VSSIAKNSQIKVKIENAATLIHALNGESERGFVLLAAAYIETITDKILSGMKTAKYTFGQKIDIISSLLLDDKDLSDILKTIKRIRNDAAHKYAPFSISGTGANFTTNIVAKCKKLHVYKDFSTVQIPFKGKTMSLGELKKSQGDKFEFMMCTIVVVSYLEALYDRRAKIETLLKPKFN